MKSIADVAPNQAAAVPPQANSSKANVNDMIEGRIREGLFHYYDKNKKEIKAIDEQAKHTISSHLLKVGFDLGKAVSEGDCFFDAIDQGLTKAQVTIPEGYKDQSAEYEYYSGYKKLRLICNKYAKKYAKEKDHWLKEQIVNDRGDYQRYLTTVQYTAPEIENDGTLKLYHSTATWGNAHIDGRIICDVLNIQLHVIEVMKVENSVVLHHQLIDRQSSKSISEKEANELYQDAKIIHLAVYQGSLHFVPVLSQSLRAQNERAAQADNHKRSAESAEVSAQDDEKNKKLKTDKLSPFSSLGSSTASSSSSSSNSAASSSSSSSASPSSYPAASSSSSFTGYFLRSSALGSSSSSSASYPAASSSSSFSASPAGVAFPHDQQIEVRWDTPLSLDEFNKKIADLAAIPLKEIVTDPIIFQLCSDFKILAEAKNGFSMKKHACSKYMSRMLCILYGKDNFQKNIVLTVWKRLLKGEIFISMHMPRAQARMYEYLMKHKRDASLIDQKSIFEKQKHELEIKLQSLDPKDKKNGKALKDLERKIYDIEEQIDLIIEQQALLKEVLDLLIQNQPEIEKSYLGFNQ